RLTGSYEIWLMPLPTEAGVPGGKLVRLDSQDWVLYSKYTPQLNAISPRSRVSLNSCGESIREITPTQPLASSLSSRSNGWPSWPRPGGRAVWPAVCSVETWFDAGRVSGQSMAAIARRL